MFMYRKEKYIMRASGILLPITSLPSKYGIGCFSKSAYDFIDILKQSGQKYWQILPIGPTGFGDSPYQSYSSFAGNPYFIDPQTLIREGLLTKKECDGYDFGESPRYVDYGRIYTSRFHMLKIAYERSSIKMDKDFHAFQNKNAFWLENYSLYMAIKDYHKGESWTAWKNDIKFHERSTLEYYYELLEKEIVFYKYIQYLFTLQWNRLRAYANKNEISIIGDMPIYVALDSADIWSDPVLFNLDEELRPIEIAGCPPDGFSSDGQLWGNPLYRWDIHKRDGYSWWRKRIDYSFQLYDVIRLDHFKGFDEYFAIPYGDKTAKNGIWKKGPGMEFFQTILKGFKKTDFIAEDLGEITESVRKLLNDTGYPGMKVLEFAFDSLKDSAYLPHNYNKNCVVYTGTHDNNTIRGWFDSISQRERTFVIKYINKISDEVESIHWDMIRLAQQSVARLCIIPLQDYLGLGHEARINSPSTLGHNWKWRMLNGEITQEVICKIREMTKLYGRSSW
jgi:4-alpha-glucanotransferase